MTYDEENAFYWMLTAHKNVCKYGRENVDMFTPSRVKISDEKFKMLYTCKCGYVVQFIMHDDSTDIVCDS